MNLFRLLDKRSLTQASVIIQLTSVLICALLWGVGSVSFSYFELEKQLGTRMQRMASLAAALIPGEIHEQIVQSYLNQDPELTSRPFFKQVQNTLAEIEKQSQIGNDIYTFIQPEWATHTLISMASSYAKANVGGGHTASPTALQSLEEGIPTHSSFYKKKNQIWISAVAPIKTSSGKIVGAVEINYRAHNDIALLQKKLMIGIGALTLLCLLIVGFISFKTGRWYSSVMTPLLNAFKKASEGVLEGQVETSQKNEIGKVYEHFNAMIIRIRQKEEDLNQVVRNYQNKTAQAILDQNQIEKAMHFLLNELPVGVNLLQANGRTWKRLCSRPFEMLVGINADSPSEYLAEILRISPGPHTSWLDTLHQSPKTWINDQGQMISFQSAALRDDALGLEIALLLASLGDPTFTQGQKIGLESFQQKRNLNAFLEASLRRLTFLESQPRIQLFYRSIRFIKEGTEEFALSSIQTHLDALEVTLSEMENSKASEKDLVSLKLNSDIAALKETVQELLGQTEDQNQILEIARTKVQIFSDSLSAYPALQHDFLKKFFLEPIETFFKPFEAKMVQLAKNFGKELEPFKIKGGNLLVDPTHYLLLFRTLKHALQNSIEHGIESPSDRVACGKKTEGSITLYFAKQKTENGTFLKLVIQDDGKGIDPQRVRSSLLLQSQFNGMGSQNDHQILQNLFHDGYSQYHYQEDSTGRGFGLGYILEEAQRLGGTVELSSRPGIGTLLVVTVPEKLPPNMES